MRHAAVARSKAMGSAPRLPVRHAFSTGAKASTLRSQRGCGLRKQAVGVTHAQGRSVQVVAVSEIRNFSKKVEKEEGRVEREGG